MSTLHPHLLELLEASTSTLPDVSRRTMFGCEALFAHQAIFALVWKTGRIGLKLTDPVLFDELHGLPGAERWSPGGKMTMSHWLLVPESFHDDTEALKRWAQQAHALAMKGGTSAPTKKPTKKAPAPSTKKAAKKKPGPAKKKGGPAKKSGGKKRR